jgi:hypothetical protein
LLDGQLPPAGRLMRATERVTVPLHDAAGAGFQDSAATIAGPLAVAAVSRGLSCRCSRCRATRRESVRAGAIYGAINGDVDIGLGIFDHHFGDAGSRNLYATALVFAAARAVEVGKQDGNPADVVVRPVEREVQAPLDVLDAGPR